MLFLPAFVFLPQDAAMIEILIILILFLDILIQRMMYIFIEYIDRQTIPVTLEGLQEEKLRQEECVMEVLQEKESVERLIHDLKSMLLSVCS